MRRFLAGISTDIPRARQGYHGSCAAIARQTPAWRAAGVTRVMNNASRTLT